MKNPFKNKDISSLLSGGLFGLVLIAFLVSSVGCSKRDSNNANFNGFNNGGIFGSPGFNGATSLQAIGVDASGVMELVLALSTPVQGALGNYYATGQVSAQGQLNIRTGLQCGGGFLNPGSYNLVAVQPGVINNGVFQISLQGPNSIVGIYGVIIETFPKIVSSTGLQGLDELSATVSICGQSIYVYGR